ncbi:Zinc finger, SWIM-type [Trema orientale]|uniref:Zinc finger, SWIM-type n=1 Tax=Trema orientale TaxID=63057 RepID=A0A2P5CBT6_TREOI|nr:Zinc finger, SWIM-type [Trema orientale]
MARWDEILSLPVQNPPTLEFSSADIVWSKVEGWRDNIDRVALIPFARVDDFVRGESSNKDCPTRFHVEARRRRRPTMPYKPKVDGVLEYILYWCSFGPDDHRKGGIVRPSRSTYVPKKKNAGRPNTKRGCTCHFIVKRLIAEPSVALIIYNEDKHVDKKGLPCHGPQDKKAAGTRAVFAPYISEDLRLRVLSLLYVGVSVETIMQRHNETVERQGGPCNRDDLLTHRYVRRQERSIRRSTYELDTDDSVSVSMWVESHQSNVFFFEDFSDSDPFTLGIQTEWQLQQMIRFGNRSLLVSDSKFGTNKLKYPVHSLLVFNPDNKAIPVAWIISPRFASSDADKWMRALYNRVQTKDPTWKLAGFIVDDPLADVYAIKDVFQCSVLISFWRVRHAWHKNLMQKCKENEIRLEISRRLGGIVDIICQGQGTMGLFEDFMEDFVDEADFMDYFKAAWYPRIGKWINAIQTLPLASQETCAAMEFYHNQLKVRLLSEKNTGVYQRTDWLVDKLNTKVHSYFWLDEYSGKDAFARYRKEEWVSGLTSWRKALKISDSDVVVEGGSAKVTDQLDRDRVHVVWNPGSQFGICDCHWAEMGNLCEHMLKVISIWRRKKAAMPSISMLQYHKALMNMLHCPPNNSLIRDHAISLAVFVQKQINALLSDTSDISKDQPISGDRGPESVNEGSGDILSREENGSLTHEANGRITGDAGGELNDLLASGNGICAESIGEEITCTEMDIDPSSICISPPSLHSVDEVVSSGVLLENSEKVLISSEIEQLPSKDAALTNINSSEDHVLKNCSQESEMDIESVSMDIPPSTMDFVEQCTVTHQNDVKPIIIANKMGADTISNKTCPFIMTMPVESQGDEIAIDATSDVNNEDKILDA